MSRLQELEEPKELSGVRLGENFITVLSQRHVDAKEDHEFPMFIGMNRYEVPKGDVLTAVLPVLHRDPTVYGEDANEFKPERMSEENFNQLPPNSWKVGFARLSMIQN